MVCLFTKYPKKCFETLFFFCQTPVLGLGLGADFTFAGDNHNNKNNKNDKNDNNAYVFKKGKTRLGLISISMMVYNVFLQMTSNCLNHKVKNFWMTKMWFVKIRCSAKQCVIWRNCYAKKLSPFSLKIAKSADSTEIASKKNQGFSFQAISFHLVNYCYLCSYLNSWQNSIYKTNLKSEP